MVYSIKYTCSTFILPHGENTLDSHVADPEVRNWQKGTRDVRGVLPSGVEVGGLSGVWVPSEGTEPRKT